MKLFVSALEYSANVHLRYLLHELVRRENIELCGIFDESILDSANSQNLGGKSEKSAESTIFCHSERSEESKKNPSLRADSQNLRGNPQDLQAFRSNHPPCKFNNYRLPRSHSLARNDESKKFCARGTSLCDTNSLAVMGFIDVLKKAKFFLDLRPKCLNLALSADKILLMDSSSFNIPLAKMIKSSNPNKRIIYYILPQVWAWKPWRAKAIEANCDKLAAILPFEVARYKEKAEFVGHPLLDEIKYFREINSSLELHSAESSEKNLVILSESEESKNNPSLRADSQNLRGNPQGFARAVARSNQPPIEKMQDLQSRLPRSHSLARNDNIFLDSSVATLPQNDKNSVRVAETSNKIKLKKPLKSFCYFWLLPKVESLPLPLNPNLPNNADSANSQNLQGGLPREQSSLAMTNFLDSSLRKCSAQNDNMGQIAESSPIFSFMPGSRFGEIKRIFPIFLQVKDALKARDKDAKFHLIVPQKFAFQNLAQIYGDLSDFHISFDAHLSLFQSRFAFICSGTATLECALIGTPFVLGYKCRAFEAFIARCFLKIKFIGLANILYEKISPNEMFHTELIQGDLTAHNLLNALDSANKSEFLRKSLALRKYLKNGSASAVAKMLYDL